MDQRPNLIVVLTDDLGYGDCSCYGQKTWTTPHIDRLAAEGMRFTDFYTTSPVCSPARASLITGLNSGKCPIRHLKDPYLPNDIMTLPRQLRSAGYVSACIGKYGIGRGQPATDPYEKGFDYHYGYNSMRHAHNYYPPFLVEDGGKVPLRNRPPDDDWEQWETGVGVAAAKIDYSVDFIERKALRFLEEHREQPFFLYYCPTLPHANNEGGTSPDGMEVDTYGEFADRDWPANEKGFARMVQRIDETVGRLVEKVRECGLEEQTLILFSSDNGPHNEGGHSVTRFDSAGGFQGYKRSLHEGGIRIFFIAWWPGTIQPNQVSDHLGYFPDIANTFCELAGTERIPYSDGLSLAPLLRGDLDKQKQHPHLYFEYLGQTAVRQGDWKYLLDETGREGLYHLPTDRHEDSDRQEAEPELFARLQELAALEHHDYDPFGLPVLAGTRYGL